MVAGWSFSTVVLQVVDTARLGGPRMRGAVHRRTTGRALRGGMTAASETAHYSITTSTQGKGSLGLGRQQPRHRHRRRRRRRRRRAHPRADAGATVEHRRHHRATHPLPPRLPGLGSLRVVSARRRSFGGREARPAATYRSGERSLAWAPSTRMAVSAHAAVSANTKSPRAAAAATASPVATHSDAPASAACVPTPFESFAHAEMTTLPRWTPTAPHRL
jgi:hypothetical protein